MSVSGPFMTLSIVCEYNSDVRFYALVGWMNLLGQIAGVASTEFGLSRMIWAAVNVHFNGEVSCFLSRALISRSIF